MEFVVFVFGFVKFDEDIIDVGVNVGFFFVGLVKKLIIGCFLVVELNIIVVVCLLFNIVSNGVGVCVFVFEGVVVDVFGEMILMYFEGKEEYFFLVGFYFYFLF